VLNPLFDQKDQLAEPNFGERYAHALRDQQGADQRFSTEHPIVDTTTKLTGGIASMAPAMAAAPWTFGVGGTLPGMVARSAITGATLGGADAAARGQDIPRGALYGGIFGAALPATGRAIRALVSPARMTAAANAIADSANTSAGAREAAAGAGASTTAAPDSAAAVADSGASGMARAETAEGLQLLRQQYVDKVTALADKAKAMRAEGHSEEDIARAVSAERRALGVQYKARTPPDELAQIHERNLKIYGDKLGPTIEWHRNAGRSWEQIIESASRPGGGDLGL
jgi:hypothetical protein